MKHTEAVCTPGPAATLGRENVWALILAGGDGTRLQGLTRIITGVPIPKQSLGYIIPAGTPSDLERLGGFYVQGFEEKPDPSRAAVIIRQGALWSSFIMLFRVRRMLEIVRSAQPREVAAMERLLGDALHGTGVHVMVVRPGFVRTSMTAGRPETPLATTPEAVATAIELGLRRRSETVWVPGRCGW